MASSKEHVARRTQILSDHLLAEKSSTQMRPLPCLSFSPPEASEKFDFNVHDLRRLLDGHSLEDRDYLFELMKGSELFNPRKLGTRVFVSSDYNHSMEEQREETMRRIAFLSGPGVFDGWLTGSGPERALKTMAQQECLEIFDHSLAIKLGVHFFPLVRGIKTVTIYDPNTGEFIINTPCESAQKYWIGGAANHVTHAIVFSQLYTNGNNQGVHAFIAQLRDSEGNVCPSVRIADCGHKIGLNGVDNGRIWFDNVRVPRENLLNSAADVSPDGHYQSAISDPDQRFAAFLAPLTSGRVTISVLWLISKMMNGIYQSKIALAIAVRYALTRRAFSISSTGPETLLLDYPSHQRRLLPLLAKTYAMSCSANDLKRIYVNRTSQDTKAVHVYSSAFKAMFTWHNNVNPSGEYDVQSTFEGDNNVLLQQVSKALLAEYAMSQKKNQPIKVLGLEHMNSPRPVIPDILTSAILRSSLFQAQMFCLRERDLLKQFTVEISEHVARGKSKEHAFVLSHQLSEDLASAFSERAIFQSFLKPELASSMGPIKNVLGLLRTMYALVSMEEDLSFLRYGFLSVTNACRQERNGQALQ